jgi:putative spermidine/putrescine transport system substrate-binding protein
VFGAALANGGSLDNIEPGIEFFAELKKRGNFIPVDNYPADIAKGTTPIAIKWDYLLIGYKYQWHGNPPLTVVVPPSGVVGGFYCQAISRYSYHPDAARLWEEFLYSDEGQILYLEGYAHPVRYNNLVKEGKIPPALAKKLPPAEAYARAQFPTVAQLNKAARVVQAQWGPKVLGS